MRKIFALVPAGALFMSAAWGQFEQEAEVVTVPVTEILLLRLAYSQSVKVRSPAMLKELEKFTSSFPGTLKI